MKKRAAVGIVVVLILFGSWFAFFRYPMESPDAYTKRTDPMESPDAYTKGTELYYLAWVDHGRYWESAAAAKKLADMPDKAEYEITKKLRDGESGLVRHMLTLCLFDMRPAAHEREARELLGKEGTWMKTDFTFENQIVDFYFDWGGQAAIRLAGRGYATRETLAIVYQLAYSFYPADRARAKSVFDAFEGIPPYDPTPQPKTLNDVPQKTETQMRAVRSWLDRNLSNVRWSATKEKYQITR